MNFQKALQLLRKKKFRLFVMAFLVSLLMWFIANLSKEYTKEVTVKINFEEVTPGNLIKCKDSVFNVKIKGTGFTLWSNPSKNKTYNIKADNDKKQWNWQDNQYAFRQLFAKSIEIVNVSPSEIAFTQFKLAQKKVVLQSQVTVKPKLGYGITEVIKQQDSIVIYGNQKEIEKVKNIKTDPIVYQDVTTHFSGEVGLKIPAEVLRTSIKKLNYRYTVEPFTQGEFSVPIQLLNVPENVEVSIFPKQIQVQFQSPLSLFETYKPQQFLITVDCSHLENQKSLLVVLNTTPKGMKNVRLLKKSVTFLKLDK